MYIYIFFFRNNGKMIIFMTEFFDSTQQDLTHDSKGQPAFTLEGSDPPSLWRALTELPGPCRLFFFREPVKRFWMYFFFFYRI